MPCGEAYKGDPFQDEFPPLHGLLDAGQPVPGCGRASAMLPGI